MSEVYPCGLPLPLVQGFSVEENETVRLNDLSSGPPIARLMSSETYTMFSAEFNFSGLQMQVFRAWYHNTIKRGSKTFTIDLNLDGELYEHTCYMRNPQMSLNGKRWSVSARLISTGVVVPDECDTDSMINIINGFDPVTKSLNLLDELVENDL